MEYSSFPVLVVDDDLKADTAAGRAARAVIGELKDHGLSVIEAATYDDGETVLRSNPGIGCLMLEWGCHGPDRAADGDTRALDIIALGRSRGRELPIFVVTSRVPLSDLPYDALRGVTGYMWKLEDTPHFIAGRVAYAVHSYVDELLPPFFGRLVEFAEHHEYSWHTPGHTGGTAFLKTPVGQSFHSFFGENMLRSDLSISVGELGSLLDHSGVVGAAEDYAARVFGADFTMFVTNGTSTSNKIVLHGCVTQGDAVLIDRNCHKSVQHGLSMTGSIPVYLRPLRNGYGIIGPVSPAQLEPAAIDAAVEATPLRRYMNDGRPVYAVVTNSTYDGLCYDVEAVDLHPGRARRSHPLRRGLVCLRPLQPALRAALRHVPRARRRERADRAHHAVDPQAAGGAQPGLDDPRAPGPQADRPRPLQRSLHDARLDLAAVRDHRLERRLDGDDGRRLGPEPDAGEHPGGDRLSQDDGAPRARDHRARRVRSARPLVVRRLAARHGGRPGQRRRVRVQLDAPTSCSAASRAAGPSPPTPTGTASPTSPTGYCLLDPIKVTLLTPGIDSRGTPAPWGIPAELVSRFLETRGIVVEKTGDYTMLFLFSIGITRGKWGTLVDALFDFKSLYDRGALLRDVFPDLVRAYGRRYCRPHPAHARRRDARLRGRIGSAAQARARLRGATRAGHAARRRLREPRARQGRDDPAAEMAGRASAVMVVPYPPGIPILMPGERVDGPTVDYLEALQQFDRRFPGFSHHVLGVALANGERDETGYRVSCLLDDAVTVAGGSAAPRLKETALGG